MDYIDLHIHTTASDGSMTPSELVRHAKSKGLKAIAITDHDTTDGLQDALREGKAQDIEVIAGVEIGVDFYPEMHLLGYFLNGDYSRISTILDDLIVKRQERNPKMIKKLNDLGFDISIDEVSELAQSGVVGRPHMANMLLKKGYVESIQEAFEKYLGTNRAAYVKKDKLTPEEGITAIINAGGIPVLAHPIYLGLEYAMIDELIKKLSGYGLMGIEAFYSDNTDNQTNEILELSKKYNLLITGGSDFHGSYKPEIEVGVGRGNLRIPYQLLEAMKSRIT